MSDLTYQLILNTPGQYQFTMPAGFQSNVQVYAWGAGGGGGGALTGQNGVFGGGGGYAASTISVFAGNVVTVEVGGAGGDANGPTGGANFGAPIPPTPYTLFDSGFDDYYSVSSTGLFYTVQTQIAGSAAFNSVSSITDSGGAGPRSFTAVLNAGYTLHVFHTHAAASDFTSADGTITFYQNGYNSGIYSNTQASGPAYSWLHFWVNGSHAGSTTNLTYYGGAGGDSNPIYNDDNHIGGGGAGGGATSVTVSGIPLVVAAGGGGAGGGWGYQLGIPGLPGGVQSSPQSWYPVTLSYAWNNFMNAYAIWTGGSQDVTTNTYQTIVNFPTSGTYTFYLSTDNYGSLTVDSTLILSYSDFTTTGSTTHSITAGSHTITLSITNTGGPAGVAARILNPDTSELWDTRYPQNFPDLNSASNGATGNSGYAAGGGGGGGIFGGLGGNAVGDDAGSGGPGNGGQNLGDHTEPGSGTLCGGRNTAYFPLDSHGNPVNYIGNADQPGYLIMVFSPTIGGYIKESGAWTQITAGYYKAPADYIEVNKTVQPPPVVQTFTTVGTTSWTVPTYVTSVDVTYPTTSGLVTQTLTVTPGQVIAVTVGDYGQTSAFGGINVTAYDTQVFSYAGNVDAELDQDIQIATASQTSFSMAGYNAAQEAGATAAGIYYMVTYEGWHGDLYSTISITPVLQSTLVTNFQVYTASGSGRYFPSEHAITSQPTVANNYVYHDYQYDSGGGEGSYSWTTNIQQQGYFKIRYQQVLPPNYVLVNQGGWKQIQRIYLKKNGAWKPLISTNIITPSKLV
jgi:hypothetical protein